MLLGVTAPTIDRWNFAAVEIGPSTTTVPAVNLTQAAATTAITSAGLTLGAITTARARRCRPVRSSVRVRSRERKWCVAVLSPSSSRRVRPVTARRCESNPSRGDDRDHVRRLDGCAITNTSSTTVPAGSVISQNLLRGRRSPSAARLRSWSVGSATRRCAERGEFHAGGGNERDHLGEFDGWCDHERVEHDRACGW